jgi:hypothetical protein
MSSPRNTRSAPNPRRTERQRGSALIAVLVISAAVATIAAHLFVRGLQEQRLATRSFYQSVALNLAEAGLEEAMWAINNSWVDTTRGWALASDGSGARTRTTLNLSLSQGTGEIYVRIDAPGSNSPSITALGLVRLPRQGTIIKQLRVPLTRRAPWSNAVVSKGSITFNGNNVTVDAYDSSVGPWNATTNRLDRANVATNTANNAGLSVNNADIYGSVATGGSQPVVGPNGSILGATSPTGLPNNIDPSRVRLDFSSNLPDVVAPGGTSTSLGAVTSSITLPRTGDSPGADGRYRYTASSVSLTNNTLTINNAAVDLIVSGDVSVGGGSGSIVVTNATSSSLAIYAAGNMSISGNGAINQSGSTTRMTFYGTRTQAQTATMGAQTFDLRGNASYIGTVYAPNADVSLRGGGSSGRFDGAIVGRSVTFNGNYDFHYDTRLASVSSERFFRPTAWIELVAPPSSGSTLARDNRQPFNAAF